MIAHAKKLRAQTLQEKFLDMLPSIRQQARFAFRAETPERRDDLVTEVIANCFVAFVRLMDRGKAGKVYPTPLVQYAIKQVRDGRHVGTSLNVNDVSSEHAQRSKGIVVESLDRYDQRKQEWREILIEDRHAGPAETAASRIDFSAWPTWAWFDSRLAIGRETPFVDFIRGLAAERHVRSICEVRDYVELRLLLPAL